MTTTNVIFKYMYRDASNYKLHGEAIFTNHTLLPLEEIEKQIRSCLSDGEYFIAGQVNIEERFFDVLHEDDHPWHEFESVEETSIKAFDPENWKQHQHLRDIREFIADLEKAHRSDWDEHNVRADVARLLEKRKSELKKIFGRWQGHPGMNSPSMDGRNRLDSCGLSAILIYGFTDWSRT